MNIQKHKRFSTQHRAQKNSGEIREKFGKKFGKKFGRKFGKKFGRKFGKGSGKRFGKKFGRKFGKGSGKDSGKDSETGVRDGPFCGARTGGSLKPHRAAPPGHALFCPARCWVWRGAPRGLGAPPHSPPSPPSFVPPSATMTTGGGNLGAKIQGKLMSS